MTGKTQRPLPFEEQVRRILNVQWPPPGDEADEVLGTNAEAATPRVAEEPAVETWAVPLQNIYENEDVRLDASHYDKQRALAIEELESCGHPIKPLSELATLNLPGQFTRIWAHDASYGFPYCNATELMSLAGLGTLGEKARYLSKQIETDINELIIREGWLLMTCSGTIGRVFYVTKRLDGWAATHDIIRIIPKLKTLTGFLHAYLSCPLAQKQIMGYTHGGQIDHITDKHIAGVLVPMLSEDTRLETHKRTMRALNMREQAIEALSEVANDIPSLISA